MLGAWLTSARGSAQALLAGSEAYLCEPGPSTGTLMMSVVKSPARGNTSAFSGSFTSWPSLCRHPKTQMRPSMAQHHALAISFCTQSQFPSTCRHSPHKAINHGVKQCTTSCVTRERPRFSSMLTSTASLHHAFKTFIIMHCWRHSAALGQAGKLAQPCIHP